MNIPTPNCNFTGKTPMIKKYIYKEKPAMSEKLLNEILTELKDVKSGYETMKETLNGVKSDQDYMKKTLDDVKSEQKSLKETQNEMKLEQASMKETQNEMKLEQASMKETQKLMQTQLKETNEMVHAIHHRQEETDANLEALSANVQYMMGDIKELKEGQKKQDKTLEGLSRRSVDHETDIHSLKRNIK